MFNSINAEVIYCTPPENFSDGSVYFIAREPSTQNLGQQGILLTKVDGYYMPERCTQPYQDFALYSDNSNTNSTIYSTRDIGQIHNRVFSQHYVDSNGYEHNSVGSSNYTHTRYTQSDHTDYYYHPSYSMTHSNPFSDSNVTQSDQNATADSVN
jgi:hypothetical protein